MKLIVGILLATLVLTVLPTPTEAHSGQWVVVKSNGTFLRTCPSTACAKVVLLPKWSEIRLDRHRGTWAYGYVDDYSGWISLNVVRQVQTPAAPAAPVSSGPSDLCFNNTFGSVVCAEPWVAQEIWNAAQYYGVSYWTLMAVASCESNYDYTLVEWSGATGLFQFMPETWAWIGMGDIWSVHDQSMTAAWAFANGLQSHWVCASRI